MPPGAIVLLHSGARRTPTAAALPRILSELGGRGYRFVTVEEMFSMKRLPVRSENEERPQ